MALEVCHSHISTSMLTNQSLWSQAPLGMHPIMEICQWVKVVLRISEKYVFWVLMEVACAASLQHEFYLALRQCCRCVLVAIDNNNWNLCKMTSLGLWHPCIWINVPGYPPRTNHTICCRQWPSVLKALKRTATASTPWALAVPKLQIVQKIQISQSFFVAAHILSRLEAMLQVRRCNWQLCKVTRLGM